jgi:hypothetical protein
MLGFTTGLRGKVSGKRKPVIREHNDDYDDSVQFNSSIQFFILCAASAAKRPI